MSRAFRSVLVDLFHPDFLRAVRVGRFATDFTFRLLLFLLGRDFPARVVRVFRGAAPFAVEVVVRASLVKDSAVAPSYSWYEYVPFVRFLFHIHVTREAYNDRPEECKRFFPNERWAVLQRGRFGRLLHLLPRVLFIFAIVALKCFVRRYVTFVDVALACSVRRIVFGVVITFVLFDRERRWIHYFQDEVEQVRRFKVSPYEHSIRVRAQANARWKFRHSLALVVLKDVVGHVFRYSPYFRGFQ